MKRLLIAVAVVALVVAGVFLFQSREQSALEEATVDVPVTAPVEAPVEVPEAPADPEEN